MRKTIINLVVLLTVIFISGCTLLSPLSESDGKKNQWITYKKIKHINGTTAHIVIVDPRHYQIRLIKADTLEYPSVLARRNKALIAMNAGFFQTDGRPAGPLKINNSWIELPSNKNRGALAWGNNASMRPEMFYFDRLNDASMHTGIWPKMHNIVGGIPLLLKNGQALNPAIEKATKTFIEDKHARSAFCVSNKKQIIFIYVEGFWTPVIQSGMSIQELSQLLVNLGCNDGINFDGGRSSTLILNHQNLKTTSLFNWERKVSNILAVFTYQ